MQLRCGRQGAVWSCSAFLGSFVTFVQLILLGFLLGADSCVQQTAVRARCG